MMQAAEIQDDKEVSGRLVGGNSRALSQVPGCCVTLLVMHRAAGISFRLRTPRGPDGGSAPAGPCQVGRNMMSRAHLFPLKVLAPEVVDEQRVHDLRGSHPVSQRRASQELRTVAADLSLHNVNAHNVT